MADETTNGGVSKSREELKRAMSAAVETRTQNLSQGMSKDDADASLRDEIGTLTVSSSCEEDCMNAWMACIAEGRPQEDCDAEFGNCMAQCDDTPVVDPDV